MFRVKLVRCLQGRQAVFYSEDGRGNKFLRNVSLFLPHYTASCARRPYPTHLHTHIFLYLLSLFFVLRRLIGFGHTFSRSVSKGNFDKFFELYLAIRATNIFSMPYFGSSQRYCWRFMSPLMLCRISWEFPKFWKSVILPFSVRVPKNALWIAGP
jgi:hypothetical protein